MKWKVALPVIAIILLTILKFMGGAVFFFLSRKSILLVLICIGILIVYGLFAATICAQEFPKLWREIKAYCKKILIHEISKIKRFFHTCKSRITKGDRKMKTTNNRTTITNEEEEETEE